MHASVSLQKKLFSIRDNVMVAMSAMNFSNDSSRDIRFLKVDCMQVVRFHGHRAPSFSRCLGRTTLGAAGSPYVPKKGGDGASASSVENALLLKFDVGTAFPSFKGKLVDCYHILKFDCDM